jgi:hypothetical protein
MVCHHFDLPRGPFTVSDSTNVRVVPGDCWDRSLSGADYDFVYVIPAGLNSRKWLGRLRSLRAPRIVLDLDPDRQYYLTVLTPFDGIRGYLEVPRFLDATGKVLVWCYDPVSFAMRNHDFAHPVFGTYAKPRMDGFGKLFAEAGRILGRTASP